MADTMRIMTRTTQKTEAKVPGYNETLIAEGCSKLSQYTTRKISNFYALLRQAGHSTTEALELAKTWFNVDSLETTPRSSTGIT